MEWSQISKDWAKVQNKFTTKWSKLTASDITTIGGKRDELVKSLETRYSMDKSAAQKDVDTFVKTLHV